MSATGFLSLGWPGSRSEQYRGSQPWTIDRFLRSGINRFTRRGSRCRASAPRMRPRSGFHSPSGWRTSWPSSCRSWAWGPAVVFFWGWGFHWVDLGLLLGMYVLTALGITVGFHRLFTHRSFETYAVVQFILGVLGSMALQGPLLKWVAFHRRHHEHSDESGDPHSPHLYGGGVAGLLRGLWHAHLGWVFRPDPPDLDRYVKDLSRSDAAHGEHAVPRVGGPWAWCSRPSWAA